MKGDQRVSKTVLQWISVAVGGCLLGGFLVALLFDLGYFAISRGGICEMYAKLLYFPA